MTFENIGFTGGSVTGDGGNLLIGAGNEVTLSGALVSGGSAQNGGGISVSGSTLSITDGSIVANNNATAVGGGIHADESLVILRSTDVKGNDSDVGGGIAAYDSELAIREQSRIGTATGRNTAGIGGGVYFSSYPASVRMILTKGSEIQHNQASQRGGGVYASGDGEVIVAGRVQNNDSNQGGGIFASGGEVRLESGRIKSNTADTRGGGVYVDTGEFIVEHDPGCDRGSDNVCGRIDANEAETDGGGVYIRAGTANLDRVKLDGNQAADGAAVYLAFGGTLELKNALVVNNVADTATPMGSAVAAKGSWSSTPDALLNNVTIADNTGFGLEIHFSASDQLVNRSIIWDNTDGVTGYANFGECTIDQGGFVGNPDPPQLLPDYRLGAGSAALDACYGASDHALDGAPRFGLDVDMGAFEQ